MIIIDNYILDDLKNYVTYHLLHKSGNKVVDDFISYTQINSNLGAGMLEFVPYDQFKDIEIIAKVESYEATWIEGNIKSWNKKEINFKRSSPMQVVLKRFNNSESITSNDINEVGIH